MLRLRVASVRETTPLQIHACKESKTYSIEEKVEEIFVSPSSYSSAIEAKTGTTISSPNQAKNTQDGVTTNITAGSQDKAARESSNLWGFNFPSKEETEASVTVQIVELPSPGPREGVPAEKKRCAFLRSLCF